MGMGIRRKRLKTDNKGDFKSKDARRPRGRKPGATNTLPRTLKEAILGAYEKIGSDGKGKDGLIGYFVKLFQDKIDGKHFAVRLAEKILPMQVTGAGGGPVQVLNIPPEYLKNCSSEELVVMETVFSRINGDTPALVEQASSGDADSYARAIGMEPASSAKH